jgi:hypothetical protein
MTKQPKPYAISTRPREAAQAFEAAVSEAGRYAACNATNSDTPPETVVHSHIVAEGLKVLNEDPDRPTEGAGEGHLRAAGAALAIAEASCGEVAQQYRELAEGYTRRGIEMIHDAIDFEIKCCEKDLTALYEVGKTIPKRIFFRAELGIAIHLEEVYRRKFELYSKDLSPEALKARDNSWGDAEGWAFKADEIKASLGWLRW